MALFHLERKSSDADGSRAPIQVEVTHEAGFIQIGVEGYGDATQENAQPILIEHYQGSLRVVCFNDINSESPIVIDMEGANEQRRCHHAVSR